MSALATATRRLGPRAARGFASTSASSTSVSSSDASIAWTVGDYARTGVALGIGIATAGVCESTINDLYVWSLCKRKAMPAIETHARLQRSLGEPMRADAWWNASVTHRGKGNLASCVFLLDGARASCDVQVVMARAPSRSEGMYAFASYVPPIRPMNSAMTFRWYHGGRKVCSAHIQRGGKITKSQTATPGSLDGQVSTVKIDGSGWSHVTELTA